MIYETDTDSVAFWDGSYWRYIEARKNLLYNGAMQIAQRGTSTASITTAGYYTADRWNLSIDSLGTWTQSVTADAPTGSGFRNSLKMACTTIDGSPAAGDYCMIQQRLEGQDMQSLRKGTSSAQQLTLSFWVKSFQTGTFIVEFNDSDNTRQISKSYTVNASATWEYKTLTVPADATGALDNDNARSFDIYFWLAAGSTFSSGTLNSSAWASVTNANRAVGQTNVASSTNNYWQITGVQLNVGAVAAPYEFKSYQDDLRECQRYYYRITPGTGKLYSIGWNNTTTGHQNWTPFAVSMRSAPTALEQNGTAADYRIAHANTGTNCSSVPTFSSASTDGARTSFTVASGLTAGDAAGAEANSSTSYLGWSAEL